MARSV